MDKLLALVALILLVITEYESLSENRHTTDAPCPHGHDDWNDCPDCCH